VRGRGEVQCRRKVEARAVAGARGRRCVRGGSRASRSPLEIRQAAGLRAVGAMVGLRDLAIAGQAEFMRPVHFESGGFGEREDVFCSRNLDGRLFPVMLSGRSGHGVVVGVFVSLLL